MTTRKNISLKLETRASDKENNAKLYAACLFSFLLCRLKLNGYFMDNSRQCVEAPFIVEAEQSNEDIEETWEALVEYITLYMLSKIQKIKGPVAFPMLHQILRDGYYHANEKKKKVSNKTAYLESYIPNKDPRRE